MALIRLDVPQQANDESVLAHCTAFTKTGALSEQSDFVVLAGCQTKKPGLVSEFIWNAFTRDTAR